MTQRLSVNSMPTHAPKKRQGGASCCISTPWVAPGSDIPMKAHRRSTVDESLPDARGQLSLAIDSATAGTPAKPVTRRPFRRQALEARDHLGRNPVDAGRGATDREAPMHDSSLDTAGLISSQECAARPPDGLAQVDDRTMAIGFAPTLRQGMPHDAPLR